VPLRHWRDNADSHATDAQLDLQGQSAPHGQGRGRVREMGADYLAYLVVDAVVDAYFPVLDELGDRIHALEAEVPEKHLGNRLVGKRRDIGWHGHGQSTSFLTGIPLFTA
jgi:hypothetical protein